MTYIFIENLTLYISILETVLGVGIGFGPVIGTLVYSYTSWAITMYTFGLMLLAATIVIQIYLPSGITDDEDEEETDN